MAKPWLTPELGAIVNTKQNMARVRTSAAAVAPAAARAGRLALRAATMEEKAATATAACQMKKHASAATLPSLRRRHGC